MSEAAKDTVRALKAVEAIRDGRDLEKDMGAIMVTLEHVVATLLLATMRDPRKAVGMLESGLVLGVTERIAFYAAKQG